MGNETKCAKCGSTHIVPSARVIDRDYDGTTLGLCLGVARKPEAFLFKREELAEVRAQVCGDCGHVELFTKDARSLYKAYLESIGDTPGAVGG